MRINYQNKETMTELEKCNAGLVYSFSDPEMVARKGTAPFQCLLMLKRLAYNVRNLLGRFLEIAVYPTYPKFLYFCSLKKEKCV